MRGTRRAEKGAYIYVHPGESAVSRNTTCGTWMLRVVHRDVGAGWVDVVCRWHSSMYAQSPHSRLLKEKKTKKNASSAWLQTTSGNDQVKGLKALAQQTVYLYRRQGEVGRWFNECSGNTHTFVVPV